MLSSTLYRLSRDTVSLETVGPRKQIVRVPQNAVIEVLGTRRGPEGRSMSRVFWEGKTLEMFTEDIERRGEAIVTQTSLPRVDHETAPEVKPLAEELIHKVAEEEGFEPPEPFRVQRFSRPPP